MSQSQNAGAFQFISRPRAWLERLWPAIAERGRGFAPIPAGNIDPLERARQLAKSLVSERGEASGAAVAQELLAVLKSLTPEQRGAFFGFLAESFEPDMARLQEAANAFIAAPSAETAAELADKAEPPRQELLRRLNMAQGGTAALVNMRRELQEHLSDDAKLKRLDADLRHLFASWFNRGFLELRQIDWQTPAAILEKLIAYEAVHEIQGWEDLRRRLASDRRCFAFFHPALPGDPLIFVEVALVKGLAGSVQALLERDTDEAAQLHRAEDADTAIFYSISNCQDGLRGISFGSFLIKQVVEELRSELPGLRQFSTLSPVPGFRRWLEARMASGDLPGSELNDAQYALANTPELAQAVRPALEQLCALYLTSGGKGKTRTDPVAKFHLGNGARLERINWMGNPSRRGMEESYGIMVNYLYDPAAIEANHEAFTKEGIVTRSAEVAALVAHAAPVMAKGVGARGKRAR